MIRPVSLAALILAALNVSLRAAEPIPVPMRTIATVGFNATSPVWSSNSDTIAFVERIGSAMVGNIWTVKATGGAKRLTTGGQYGCPVWTPTGGLVAARVANNRWSWVTINTSTGKATPYTPNRVFTPSGRGFVPSAATFSPDGSMLAFDICATGQTMEDSGRIQILNVRKGTVSDLPVPDKSIAFNPTWSPCGKFIAYQRLPKGWYFNRTGDESYCQIWATDIKGGKTRQMTIPEKEISFGSPRWSRDGKYLAVEKWLVSMRRMTRRDTWITGITDSTTGAFLFNQGQNTGAIAWAPDSRRFATIASRSVNGRFANEIKVGDIPLARRTEALSAPMFRKALERDLRKYLKLSPSLLPGGDVATLDAHVINGVVVQVFLLSMVPFGGPGVGVAGGVLYFVMWSAPIQG